MKTLLTFIPLLVTFSVLAKSPSSKVTLIKCALDIVDYGFGESQGLRFSAQTLQEVDNRNTPVANLLEACIDFKASNKKTTPERSRQLAELEGLRNSLSPNVYFFLRGVIRPLITCAPSGLLNRCESATGKRWMETVIFDQRRTTNHYRLGHSTAGPIVRGIVSFDANDQEYLDSLPSALAVSAQEGLMENDQARFLRFKVLKKKSTMKYILHYFRLKR